MHVTIREIKKTLKDKLDYLKDLVIIIVFI